MRKRLLCIYGENFKTAKITVTKTLESDSLVIKRDIIFALDYNQGIGYHRKWRIVRGQTRNIEAAVETKVHFHQLDVSFLGGKSAKL